MTPLRTGMLFILCSAVLSLIIPGCGPSADPVPEVLPAADSLAAALPAAGLLPALPADALQPWEQSGPVTTDPARASMSAFEADTLFTPGVERFSEGGSVADLGEATQLQSGSPGSLETSYAVYRLPLGAQQPGALALDVNLPLRSDDAAASYYLALSDYSSGRWEWHGPYREHHVRLARSAARGPDVLAAANYASESGNMFVCVLVTDGSRAEVLGLSLAMQDTADATAPPQPAGLVATPVMGGLELAWSGVLAGDLAGYRIYSASASFLATDAAGVRPQGYVEGSSRCLLPGAPVPLFVRIAAIDHSGNEGPASGIVSATPLAGPAVQLAVELAQPSVLRDDSLALSVQTASPGLLFDYDLDGDGSFELTGQAPGQQFVDTSSAGIIRPRVRAASPDGEHVALGGASLLVVSNMRPVASALAAPQSGTAPLLVDFDASVSTDFDGVLAGGGWDFDGDGLYDLFDEESTASLAGQFLFGSPGLYNARLRVIDDQGAWDVDTVSIFVASPGQNLPPQITQAQATPALAAPGENISFLALATDPDGSVAEYAWDFDNDGSDDSLVQSPGYSFAETGFHNVRLRVSDDEGASDTDYIAVLVQDAAQNLPPVAVLNAANSSILLGKNAALLAESLSAVGSYDPEGGSLSYAFDLLGTGFYGSFNSLQLSPNYDFSNAGIYQTGLRVMDDQGLVSQTLATVYVRRLNPQVLGTGVQLAGTTSITALTNSQSARIGIAYYDSANDDLYFKASVDQTGQSWLPSIVLDVLGGEWLSLAQGSSQFSLAYYRDGNLFYLGSQNDGESFNVSGLIDNSADDAGNYCSCAIVSGNPAAAYYNTTDGDLYFNRATNTGSSWSTPVPVDGTGDTGRHCSLAVVEGFPAIAYYRVDTGNLMYVRATDSAGTAWGTPVIVDGSPDDVGQFASLANVTDSGGLARPAIAYYNATTPRIQYLRAGDSSGSSWDSPVVASSGGASALQLVQLGGHLLISASSSGTVSLRCAMSVDRLGAAWGSSVQVESNSAGELSSLTKLTNGLPGMAYYDSAQELHFATPRLE